MLKEKAAKKATRTRRSKKATEKVAEVEAPAAIEEAEVVEEPAAEEAKAE
jgi:large subunit ribosomal protein L17